MIPPSLSFGLEFIGLTFVTNTNSTLVRSQATLGCVFVLPTASTWATTSSHENLPSLKIQIVGDGDYDDEDHKKMTAIPASKFKAN